MSLETDELSSAKRKLIVHDALTFVSLALVTVLLFVVTLILFRSFAAHRDELATRWSGRGQAALQAGHPDQAIVALRTALSYAPGRRAYELLLAQALGDAGHTEESYNYFLGLWETQPGNGFINLRLARLAAKKGDFKAAVNFYRASIYGTWEGDGAVRRREVRLELARYLLDQHDYDGARADLLIAGGNNPDEPGFAVSLGQMLEQAGSPADALTYYRKAVAAEPKDEKALEAAGRLNFAAGNFEEAYRLLERAVQAHEAGPDKGAKPAEVTSMMESSERILELMPSKKLPSRDRVTRILDARALAKKRLASCAAQVAAAGGSTDSLQGLSSEWASKDADMSRVALMGDSDAQDAAVKLIFDTEVQASRICGAPGGDDALLLLMAKSPHALDE